MCVILFIEIHLSQLLIKAATHLM